MNVSIVIVAFHCDDMLIQTVNSIAYSINSSCEVIIVNNGNRPLPEQVSDGVPGIKIITTGENIGFAAANNLGAGHATRKYLLLLNPDTLVGDNTIQPLVDFLEKRHDCGVCGPRVLDSNRRHVNNPEFSYIIKDLLRFTCGLGKARRVDPVDNKCDQVSGCCMMFRKEEYLSLGGMDSSLFMYAEEFELCTRYKSKGLYTAFVPEAEVFHFGGGASEGNSYWTIPQLWTSVCNVYSRFHSSAWMGCFRLSISLYGLKSATTALVKMPVYGTKKSLDLATGDLLCAVLIFLPLSTAEKFLSSIRNCKKPA